MLAIFILLYRELLGLFWSIKGVVGLIPEPPGLAKEKEGPDQVGWMLQVGRGHHLHVWIRGS